MKFLISQNPSKEEIRDQVSLIQSMIETKELEKHFEIKSDEMYVDSYAIYFHPKQLFYIVYNHKNPNSFFIFLKDPNWDFLKEKLPNEQRVIGYKMSYFSDFGWRRLNDSEEYTKVLIREDISFSRIQSTFGIDPVTKKPNYFSHGMFLEYYDWIDDFEPIAIENEQIFEKIVLKEKILSLESPTVSKRDE